MATQHNFRIKNGLEVAGVQRISAAGVITGTLDSNTTATTQSASDNSTKIATTAYTDAAITAVIGGAPGTLDTLNELAAAINDDASYASTLTTALAGKLPLAGGTLTGNLKVDASFTVNGNVDTSSSLGEVLQLSQTDSVGGFLWSVNRADGAYKTMSYHASNHKFYRDQTNLTLTLDSSSNATFTGTITSGAISSGEAVITSSSASNAFIVKTNHSGNPTALQIGGSGAINGISSSNQSFTVLNVGKDTGSNNSAYFHGNVKLGGNLTHASDLAIDVAGAITLDAGTGGTGILLKDDGAQYGSLKGNSGAPTRLVVDSASTAGYLAVAGTEYFAWNTTDIRPVGNNTLDLGVNGAAFRNLRLGNDAFIAHGTYIGGATGAWIDSNDVLVTNGRASFRGFGHSAFALGRYNSGASAGEDGSLIDFLRGAAGIGSINITNAPTGSAGIKLDITNSLELKTEKQHAYMTVSLGGANGSTVGLGQFANNGRGWWIRVTANSHYSSQVSSQVWEFTQNAYVGENHNTWLQVPETVSSSYHAGENHIALDVYRDNVGGSTSTPIHLRFRSKGKTGSTGTVYYTIESMSGMGWSHDGRAVAGSTSGTWANTSTANMNGAVGGYFPTRSKYEFPVSSGAFWTDNAVINADGAKGLYISNKGTVGIGFDKHMHTGGNTNMGSGSYDHAGTLHLAGDDSIFVQTSTYGSNSEFVHYVYNDYYKIFRTTAGSFQTALHIDNSLVVHGDLNDTSDRNLKKNIVDLPDGSLAIVSQLNPVTFDWKNTDKGSNTGFIAQDVKTVLPNDVSGTEYKESDDLHESNEGLSINTTGIVAHLVKAVQELEKRVKELEG